MLNLASNEQGEADYALWHHAIHCQGNDVLIVSSDTDVWVYGLALWEAGWPHNKNIFVQRGLSISINLGARCIKGYAQLQHVTNPIAAVVGLLCDNWLRLFFSNQQRKNL